MEKKLGCGPGQDDTVRAPLNVISVQRVPEPDPLPGISFDTRPARFSFRNHRVAGNPKHRVLPDISGITRKRKTIPSSGALLWEPQKGPQGAKKSAKSAILMSSRTVELLLVGQSLFKTYDL